MIKKNAEVNQQTDRIYTVTDYGGWVQDCDTLKEARSFLTQMPSGRMSAITAKTVTRIEIKSEQIVQTKR